jgi:hypothetical protein
MCIYRLRALPDEDAFCVPFFKAATRTGAVLKDRCPYDPIVGTPHDLGCEFSCPFPVDVRFPPPALTGITFNHVFSQSHSPHLLRAPPIDSINCASVISGGSLSRDRR